MWGKVILGSLREFLGRGVLLIPTSTNTSKYLKISQMEIFFPKESLGGGG